MLSCLPRSCGALQGTTRSGSWPARGAFLEPCRTSLSPRRSPRLCCWALWRSISKASWSGTARRASSPTTRKPTSTSSRRISVRAGALRRSWLRWHDNQHTLVTELAESGAGDEVIMSIAGHVSRAMLSRYSHVRMEAKRRALDEIAARQRAADEKRKEEAEQKQQAPMASQSALIQ